MQRWVVQVLGSKSSSDEGSVAKVIDFVSHHLTSLLDAINNEGFFLLLLHIYPFFQHPDTMFEAVYSFLDPLARRMSRKNVERLFSCVLIHLFDSATEPHQRAQLLSRTTGDLILKRFSLKTLLERFLGFYLDAVIEPTRAISKVSATKRHNTNIVRMQSQSVLTLMASDMLQSQAFEDVGRERGRKSDFSFSLALSETMGNVGYDSDKECSSDDSDDEDYSADMSLLVKTDMGHMSALSSVVEATEGMTSSLQPMSLMLNHQENLAAGAGDGGSPTKVLSDQGTTTQEGEENMMKEDGGTSKNSLAGLSAAVKLRESDSNSLRGSESSNVLSSSTGTAPQSQTHLTTTSTPDSPTRKGFSHSFSSVFSEDSTAPNDVQGITDSAVHTSSTPAVVPSLGKIPTSSLPVGNQVHTRLEEPLPSDEEEEEEEENADTASTGTSSMDPQAMAINSYLSNVAADCVSWLMRRLGPFVATQHIAKPLVESLYRCFIGILNSKGRETSAIKCLSSYAEYYGESVILKYYIPYAESLVSHLHTVIRKCTQKYVQSTL